MALSPFAKPEDLQVLAPTLSDAEAKLALELVSAAIRASVGWDVDRASRTYERTIPYRRRGSSDVSTVVLPALNVTAVTSVVVDGVTQASSAYDVTGSGLLYLHVPATEKVVVTYTAGWKRIPEEAPAVFRDVALEYAARLAGNPGGVQSYRQGQVSETFGGTLVEALDADPRLDLYRVTQ